MDVSVTKLSGRRIVDVSYLIRQLILASNHGNQECGLKDLDFVQEKRVGLKSTLHYKCRSCFLDFDLKTEFDKPNEMDVNALVTLGVCESGARFSSVETIFTSANIPFMSPSEFCVAESKLVSGVESGDNPGYCVYCGNKYAKLISHMALHHKDKKEVKRLLSLQKKNDALHRILFRALCQKGESLYCDQKSSSLCPSCNLSFSVGSFPAHTVACPLSKSDSVVTISDMMDIHSKDQPRKLANFQDVVVSKLTLKDVRDHVPKDPVLVGYCIHAMEQENGECADLRQLRNTLDAVVPVFLLMAKKSVDIKTIVDVFDISQWDTFIEAIHEYARENSSGDATPLMIDELGRHYFHVASFVVSKCKFFSLESDCCESWMGFFRNYYTKPKQLTWAILTNRLVHFSKRLSNEMYCLIEALIDGSSDPKVFEALNETTIMKIASCNYRRMFVQVDDMLISEFNQRVPISSANAEVWSVMSESEKFVAHDYECVNVCSQFGRFDAILLDRGEVRAIETILSCRRKFGVSQENVFVFGRGSSHSYKQSSSISKFIRNNHHIKPLFTSLCYEMKLFVSSTAQAIAMDRPIHVIKKSLGFVGCCPDSAEALTEVLDWAKLSRLICALNQGRSEEFSGLKFCEVSIDTDVMAPIDSEVVAPISSELRLATTDPNESAANVRFDFPMLTFDSFTNEKSQDVDQSSELFSKKARRVHWTKEERESLMEFFGSQIFTIDKLPSYKLCERAILKYKCLRKRTKAQVKAYINNEQKRYKRMNEDLEDEELCQI